jgi:DNA-directed RNA polymerase specialized sigma subunit
MNIKKKEILYSRKLKRKKQEPERADTNYVDNKAFLAEIIAYKKQVSKSKGKRVAIPDSLAMYFVKIADKLSSKGNFLNYSFKEDMVSDGIENCIQYVNNFDPKKSSNPFSYFTQIIYYAFVRRIKKEKKQMYVKYKSFINSDLSENEEIVNMLQANDCLKEYKQEFIHNFEQSIEQRKTAVRKKKQKTLELFFELVDNVTE